MPEGQSPPQELEVGPHSGPYLLVIIICGLILQMVREGSNYVLQWCSDALDPLALLVSHWQIGLDQLTPNTLYQSESNNNYWKKEHMLT